MRRVSDIALPFWFPSPRGRGTEDALPFSQQGYWWSLSFKPKGDNHGLYNGEKFVGMCLYLWLLHETRQMLRMCHLSQNEKSGAGLFLYKRGRKNIRQIFPVFRERPQARLSKPNTNSKSKIEWRCRGGGNRSVHFSTWGFVTTRKLYYMYELELVLTEFPHCFFRP